MAFGNIATFHLPIAANAGASQWGSDVRKVLDAAEASADTTCITNHGTGGSVTRTVDPYTTSATDTTEADYGWAVTPSDMNSVSGARRIFPAGDHTINGRMRDNSGLGVTCTLLMYVYRIAATTRARSLLGSNSASISLPTLSAITNAVVSVNLPEIDLAPDETIQYSFEITAAGVAITGRTITFLTGLSTTSVRVTQPGLKVLADGALSCSAAAAVTGVGGKVLGGVAAVSAAAAMSAVGGATGAGVMAVTAAATVDAKGSAVAAGVFTAAAAAVVDAKGSKVLGGVMESNSGGDTIVIKRPIYD